MTGEEGLGPTSLNAKQVGAALREVFPLQLPWGQTCPWQSSTCSTEHALGTYAVTHFTSGVQLPLSDLFPTSMPWARRGSPRVAGICSAVRGCAKQV